jgi:hypothetical protein
MSKHQLFIFGLCMTGVVLLAQTIPSTFPPANRPGWYRVAPQAEPVRRISHFNGKEWLSVLDQPTVSREWGPTAPLPTTLAAAEKLAWEQLSKIAPDASEWVTTDFQISRFDTGPNWYYAVTLQPPLQLPGGPRESFTALVDFAGTPGRVAQLFTNQAGR